MKTTRRKFLGQSLQAATILTAGAPFLSCETRKTIVTGNDTSAADLQFTQVKLPYAYNALEPYIDATTMEIHYSKHHAAYLKNVNEALTAEKPGVQNEKDFFSRISGLSPKLRNNGGGVWNHNFFFTGMTPGAGAPTGKLLDALNASFGSIDKFKEQFTQAAMTRFGSGWAWLVSENNTLKIGSTPNQDNPLMDVSEFRGTPVLGLDVWEHAYYLKYQNKRNEYVANWWSVVNWEEAAKNLG